MKGSHSGGDEHSNLLSLQIMSIGKQLPLSNQWQMATIYQMTWYNLLILVFTVAKLQNTKLPVNPWHPEGSPRTWHEAVRKLPASRYKEAGHGHGPVVCSMPLDLTQSQGHLETGGLSTALRRNDQSAGKPEWTVHEQSCPIRHPHTAQRERTDDDWVQGSVAHYQNGRTPCENFRKKKRCSAWIMFSIWCYLLTQKKLIVQYVLWVFSKLRAHYV